MKVYQIEISNLCNLTCSYCPHPKQSREYGLMSPATFEKALELGVRCGQDTVYLHNFGEPLLHPDLPSFVRTCSERGVHASFYTNGVLLTADLARELSESGLEELYVSEHTRGERQRVELLLDSNCIPIKVIDSFTPRRSSLHSWAGQVSNRYESGGENRITESHIPCIFERQNAAVILWDGRVNLCCIDVNATGARGYVDDYLDDPDKYQYRAAPICKNCTLMRGDEEL